MLCLRVGAGASVGKGWTPGLSGSRAVLNVARVARGPRMMAKCDDGRAVIQALVRRLLTGYDGGRSGRCASARLSKCCPLDNVMNRQELDQLHWMLAELESIEQTVPSGIRCPTIRRPDSVFVTTATLLMTVEHSLSRSKPSIRILAIIPMVRNWSPSSGQNRAYGLQ